VEVPRIKSEATDEVSEVSSEEPICGDCFGKGEFPPFEGLPLLRFIGGGEGNSAAK
jgi:hypothetical protein